MTKRNCASCNVGNCILKCPNCTTYYCDRNCQVQDWTNHKPICDNIGRVPTEPVIPGIPPPKIKPEPFVKPGPGPRPTPSKETPEIVKNRFKQMQELKKFSDVIASANMDTKKIAKETRALLDETLSNEQYLTQFEKNELKKNIEQVGEIIKEHVSKSRTPWAHRVTSTLKKNESILKVLADRRGGDSVDENDLMVSLIVQKFIGANIEEITDAIAYDDLKEKTRKRTINSPISVNGDDKPNNMPDFPQFEDLKIEPVDTEEDEYIKIVNKNLELWKQARPLIERYIASTKNNIELEDKVGDESPQEELNKLEKELSIVKNTEQSISRMNYAFGSKLKKKNYSKFTSSLSNAKQTYAKYGNMLAKLSGNISDRDPNPDSTFSQPLRGEQNSLLSKISAPFWRQKQEEAPVTKKEAKEITMSAVQSHDDPKVRRTYMMVVDEFWKAYDSNFVEYDNIPKDASNLSTTKKLLRTRFVRLILDFLYAGGAVSLLYGFGKFSDEFSFRALYDRVLSEEPQPEPTEPEKIILPETPTTDPIKETPMADPIKEAFSDTSNPSKPYNYVNSPIVRKQWQEYQEMLDQIITSRSTSEGTLDVNTEIMVDLRNAFQEVKDDPTKEQERMKAASDIMAFVDSTSQTVWSGDTRVPASIRLKQVGEEVDLLFGIAKAEYEGVKNVTDTYNDSLNQTQSTINEAKKHDPMKILKQAAAEALKNASQKAYPTPSMNTTTSSIEDDPETSTWSLVFPYVSSIVGKGVIEPFLILMMSDHYRAELGYLNLSEDTLALDMHNMLSDTIGELALAVATLILVLQLSGLVAGTAVRGTMTSVKTVLDKLKSIMSSNRVSDNVMLRGSYNSLESMSNVLETLTHKLTDEQLGRYHNAVYISGWTVLGVLAPILAISHTCSGVMDIMSYGITNNLPVIATAGAGSIWKWVISPYIQTQWDHFSLPGFEDPQKILIKEGVRIAAKQTITVPFKIVKSAIKIIPKRRSLSFFRRMGSVVFLSVVIMYIIVLLDNFTRLSLPSFTPSITGPVRHKLVENDKIKK